MKTSTKFIAIVSHDYFRAIFSVVKDSFRWCFSKHFKSFIKGCFSLITRYYNPLTRIKILWFPHPIWSGVLLLWRYFRWHWFLRFFVNFKSSTKFNTHEVKIFYGVRENYYTQKFSKTVYFPKFYTCFNQENGNICK